MRNKSVLRRHVDEVHEGKEQGIEFDMKVTEVFKKDPLGRQVMEGVKIRENKADHIMNSKEEFHQPGEIVPVLQGAHRKMNKNNGYSGNSGNTGNSGNSANYNNNNNNSNDTRDGGERERSTTDGGCVAGEKVTTGRGGGVLTRAKARRQNIVV